MTTPQSIADSRRALKAAIQESCTVSCRDLTEDRVDAIRSCLNDALMHAAYLHKWHKTGECEESKNRNLAEALKPLIDATSQPAKAKRYARYAVVERWNNGTDHSRTVAGYELAAAAFAECQRCTDARPALAGSFYEVRDTWTNPLAPLITVPHPDDAAEYEPCPMCGAEPYNCDCTP